PVGARGLRRRWIARGPRSGRVRHWLEGCEEIVSCPYFRRGGSAEAAMTLILRACDNGSAGCSTGGSVGERQAHCDGGAFALAAGDIEPPAMALDDVLDDRKAQAGPTGGAAAAGIDAIEPTRQVRNVLGVDSFAFVAYGQDRVIHVVSHEIYIHA